MRGGSQQASTPRPARRLDEQGPGGKIGGAHCASNAPRSSDPDRITLAGFGRPAATTANLRRKIIKGARGWGTAQTPRDAAGAKREDRGNSVQGSRSQRVKACAN